MKTKTKSGDHKIHKDVIQAQKYPLVSVALKKMFASASIYKPAVTTKRESCLVIPHHTVGASCRSQGGA